MVKFLVIITCLTLAIHFSSSKLIQRMFDIKNIPTSTWIVQQTFNARDPQSCSFQCLYNLSSCAVFSLDGNECQIGTIQGYMPIDDPALGTRVFIVDNSNQPPGATGFATLDLVLVPHVAYLALQNGQSDISLDPTISPSISLPNPHPDIAGYVSSFNFYANNKFYMCGAESINPLTTSQYCYSWSLGSGAGFAKEPGTMIYPHAQGAGVALNGSFWLTGGAPTRGGTEHKHTEIWQNGVWTAGPDLPQAMKAHRLVALSDSVVLLIGGYTGKAIKDTWTYDFTVGQWTYRNTYPGTPVWDMSAGMYTTSDGNQYVLNVGGYYVYSYTFTNSYTYSDCWLAFSGCPWCVCTVYYTDTGYAYTGVGQVSVYDVAQGTWSSGAGLSGQWYGGNMLSYQNKLYMFGGNDASGLTNVINVFDPDTGWSTYNGTLPTPGLNILPVIYNT